MNFVVGNTSELAKLTIKNTKSHTDPIGTTYDVNLKGIDTTLVLIKTISTDTGYQGYMYEDTVSNEIYVVHGGSQSLEPEDHPLDNLDEVYKDYYNNVIMGPVSNELPPQFEDAKAFLDQAKIIANEKNASIIQIGQSLGGEFNKRAVTFNAPGMLSQCNGGSSAEV